MITEIHSLLDQYWSWLKDETTVQQIGECVEITTPYLDRHNDCLQIYAIRSEDGYKLTDDSETLDDLEQSGCPLDTPKRQELLLETLSGVGVKIDERTKELYVRASKDDFAQKKHNLLQGMLAVNDLFCLATANISTLFHEEVVKWLDACKIRYTSNIQFVGESGFPHRFEFLIPKSDEQPERVLRTINKPTRDTAQRVCFAWVDTRGQRRSDTRAYAVLNDSEAPIPQNLIDAIRNYQLIPLPWKARERKKAELTA